MIDAPEREPEPLPPGVDRIAGEVVDAAIEVHRSLGPGLLERPYQQALLLEFEDRGIETSSEVPVPASYKGTELEARYRLDIVVEGSIIVEVKAVQDVTPVHEAQLLTYLNLTGHRLGFLLNFHAPLMKDGIHRRAL